MLNRDFFFTFYFCLDLLVLPFLSVQGTKLFSSEIFQTMSEREEHKEPCDSWKKIALVLAVADLMVLP